MKHLYDIFSGEDLKIAELIQRRRLQMLVHSYLYYERNTNVIDDHTFDAWGTELAKLQESYPSIASQVPWHKAFTNFDGSTGAFLPFTDPTIINVGRSLIGECGIIPPVIVEDVQIPTKKVVPKKNTTKSNCRKLF